jgi:hypothetical protein
VPPARAEGGGEAVDALFGGSCALVGLVGVVGGVGAGPVGGRRRADLGDLPVQVLDLDPQCGRGAPLLGPMLG